MIGFVTDGPRVKWGWGARKARQWFCLESKKAW
jgi:hypothetical protein